MSSCQKSSLARDLGRTGPHAYITDMGRSAWAVLHMETPCRRGFERSLTPARHRLGNPDEVSGADYTEGCRSRTRTNCGTRSGTECSLMAQKGHSPQKAGVGPWSENTRQSG